MSYRILIVDNDDAARLPLERAFRAAGFDVCAARSAEQAFELVVSGEVHLVLTEQAPPRADGLRLLWRIRAECPSVAVILLAATGSTWCVIEALRLGAQDYLVMPIETETLLTVARRAIESPSRGFAGRPRLA